jgi:putative DNA primase/helicase
MTDDIKRTNTGDAETGVAAQQEDQAKHALKMWVAAAKEGVSPFAARRQISTPGVRYCADGGILVPMVLPKEGGVQLVGVLELGPDGQRQYSAGLVRTGAYCPVGVIGPDDKVLSIAIGYAAGRSICMAADDMMGGYLAFEPDNIIHVARMARLHHPGKHILLFADDDHQVEQQLRDWLLAEFMVSSPVSVDGVERDLIGGNGSTVKVIAAWAVGANGVRNVNAGAICMDEHGERQVHVRKFENAGLARATEAAAVVGNATVVLPRFAAGAGTTFNDLHVEESFDELRAQVQAAIVAALQLADEDPPPELADPDEIPLPPMDGEAAAPKSLGISTLEWAVAHCALVQGSTDVWDSLTKLRMKRAAFVTFVGKDMAKVWDAHKDRRVISPRDLPKLSRGVAKMGGEGEDPILGMIERYTLLYTTKTVWDAEKRCVLTYEAMSLARSAELATRWITHPFHREIDADALVFDPTQKISMETHVNMFQGFPLVPKKDEFSAGLVLALLHNLCSSEKNGADVFQWVLRWLAYPLQNPGAKMQTALLFFGEKQGTGKSLFFEGIMGVIYGANGTTVGQEQLNSQFTAWRSQKLYALFEEILSRADKYTHFGSVKHMITGRTARINEKNLPERVEANHLNCVMLSNEFQAVPLEPDDRRFQCAEARSPLDPEVLALIKVKLKEGTELQEAFYHYLLHYPLEDFDEHTKPIMTASKMRMIRFGLPGWDGFYQTWAAGELQAPYCSCLSSDLYRVYERWCRSNGEHVMSHTKFSTLLESRIPKSRQSVAVGSAAKKSVLTVFHVPEAPDDDPNETLSARCLRFRDVADLK